MTLGVSQVDPRRVVVQVQVLDFDVDELADPGPGQEQRLDHQPARGGCHPGTRRR
jgi:hypothetical protein